jgi:uncharacterized protein
VELSSQSKRKVPCPECGTLSDFSPLNLYRPFCSERCKLIDLGVWASEGYRIPTPIQSDAQLTGEEE